MLRTLQFLNCSSTEEFLTLGTVAILDNSVLEEGGAILCIVGHLASSLASIH